MIVAVCVKADNHLANDDPVRRPCHVKQLYNTAYDRHFIIIINMDLYSAFYKKRTQVLQKKKLNTITVFRPLHNVADSVRLC